MMKLINMYDMQEFVRLKGPGVAAAEIRGFNFSHMAQARRSDLIFLIHIYQLSLKYLVISKIKTYTNRVCLTNVIELYLMRMFSCVRPLL